MWIFRNRWVVCNITSLELRSSIYNFLNRLGISEFSTDSNFVVWCHKTSLNATFPGHSLFGPWKRALELLISVCMSHLTIFLGNGLNAITPEERKICIFDLSTREKKLQNFTFGRKKLETSIVRFSDTLNLMWWFSLKSVVFLRAFPSFFLKQANFLKPVAFDG